MAKKVKKVNLTKEGLFNAFKNPAVAKGTCAIFAGSKAVYVGRIGSAPNVTGKDVHLHPDDYALLQRTVKKHRH